MTDLYRRSIELILANQAPGGAYVASPTFSTYHYCWFRDGAYIAYAMDLVGEHDSARRFYDWALAAVTARAGQTERAIAAAKDGMPSAELLLHTRYALDGAPGEDEWPNFQLDGFGTLLWGLAEHPALTGQPLPDSWRAPIDLLARYLAALWRFPCYDCWEEFADRVHTSTLAAIYGGLNAAARLLDDDEFAHSASELRHFVLAECVTDGSLGKSIGNHAVDANLLHVATPYRLLAPADPIMRATVARIEADLRQGGGVHRYAADSYYGGGEWVLLTAYLGWYYVDSGQPELAAPLLAWVERQADQDGNLPEQVAHNLNVPEMLTVWEERWGPSACPLLWSHAAYLTLVEQLRCAQSVTEPGMPRIVDIIPDRAMYRPGEPAQIAVELVNDTPTAFQGKLSLNLVHLDESIQRQSMSITLPARARETITFTLTPPPEPFRGYGLDVALLDQKREQQVEASGALDVLTRWSQAPRYGFLSDFGPDLTAEDIGARCASLRRYHRNVVQFYDWMWRHYQLLPPADDFTDALGRKLSLASVRAAIAGVQASNAAAFAYGAVYGAEPEYAAAHPDLVLFDEDGQRISLAELFYIMNIAPDSPWTTMIVEEFAATVRALDFDGIHLDQYGFPKTAITAAGERVDLAEHFPPLIDAARAAVVAVKPEAGVIFNAVENWPIETVAGTTQDAVYIEVWPPYDTYQDLRELIRDGKRLGGNKQVILAAYLTPFLTAPHAPESEATALLTTAVIAASGGFHLLLGERDGILCDPYYPKYATMRPAFAAEMKAYADFLVRYEEFFTASDIVDWTDDGAMPIAADGIDGHPAPGAIWAITRKKPGMRIVHLINLADQTDNRWNTPKLPLQRCDELTLTFHDLPPIDRALIISPDENLGRAECAVITNHGKDRMIHVPGVRCMRTIVLMLAGA